MKIEEVPQDLKYYKGTIIRDVNYAVDQQGQYQVIMSDGWSPKTDALDAALDDIKEQCHEILERIKKGEASPLEYHAKKNLMTMKKNYIESGMLLINPCMDYTRIMLPAGKQKKQR